MTSTSRLIIIAFGLGFLLALLANQCYCENESNELKFGFEPNGYIYGDIKSIDVVVCNEGAPYIYAISRDEHGKDIANIYFLGDSNGTQYTNSAPLRGPNRHADIGRTALISRKADQCFISSTLNSVDGKLPKPPSFIPFHSTGTDYSLSLPGRSVAFMALIHKKADPKTGKPPEYKIRRFIYAYKFHGVIAFQIIIGRDLDDVRYCFCWATENDYYKEASIACFPPTEDSNPAKVALHPFQTIPLLSNPLLGALELEGANNRTVLVFAQSTNAECLHLNFPNNEKDNEEDGKDEAEAEDSNGEDADAVEDNENVAEDADVPPSNCPGNVLFIWEYKYNNGENEVFLFKQALPLKGIRSIDTVVTKDNEGFLVVVADSNSKEVKYDSYEKPNKLYGDYGEKATPPTAVYIFKYNVNKSKFVSSEKLEIPNVIQASFQSLMPSLEILLYVVVTTASGSGSGSRSGYDETETETENIRIYKLTLTPEKLVFETSVSFEDARRLNFASFPHRGTWCNQVLLTHGEGTAVWNIKTDDTECDGEPETTSSSEAETKIESQAPAEPGNETESQSANNTVVVPTFTMLVPAFGPGNTVPLDI